MPRQTGPNILKLGEHWKDLMKRGTSPVQIADKTGKPLQVVHRAIWLGGWPNHLKELVYTHPSLFSRTMLINVFASKQRQCEKNNYALLEREMRRMVEEGRGSKPKLRNTNKKPSPAPGTKASPVFHIDKSLEASFRIKQALSLHSNVTFEESGAGEVRIFFKNEKELEFILERIEDIKFNSKNNVKSCKQNFLGFIE